MCSLSKNNFTNKNIDIEKSKNTHKKMIKIKYIKNLKYLFLYGFFIF